MDGQFIALSTQGNQKRRCLFVHKGTIYLNIDSMIKFLFVILLDVGFTFVILFSSVII